MVWAWAQPALASAQDLFEIEVFPSELAAPGETFVDLHTNAMTGASIVGETTSIDHPFHASVELTHGWTKRFETGVFLETAPAVRAHGARFGGGHIRPKFHLFESARVPLNISLAAEYRFSRGVFDQNRQAVEIVPIVETRAGRFNIIGNPAWAVTVDGPDAASLPKLSASARVEWGRGRRLTPGVEYYWKTEALKHFDANVDRHDFVMPTVDLALASDWSVDFGVGHCIVGDSERWIMKSIVGYRFH
jgi:hypothetical protein